MSSAEIHVVKNRSLRLAAIPIGVIAILALVVALFILPVRTWFHQRELLSERRIEYAGYEDTNEVLQDQVTYLKTDAGLQEAIRTQLGYLHPNERRIPMIDLPAMSTLLPEQWPYTVVSNILLVRSLDAVRLVAEGQITLEPLKP
ncbi:MAG: FtsB family cell division protein [Ilumatobacteraceae bacterium]